MPSLARELRRRNLTSMLLEFDPTAASAPTGKLLPAGARVVQIQPLGGATGGTNPTVDIGISGSGAAFHNELDADTPGAPILPGGASANTVLAADTEVWAGVGASAATGGTCRVLLTYLISAAANAGE